MFRGTTTTTLSTVEVFDRTPKGMLGSTVNLKAHTCVGFISDLDVDHLSSLIVPNQSSESQTQLPMSSVPKSTFRAVEFA